MKFKPIYKSDRVSRNVSVYTMYIRSRYWI